MTTALPPWLPRLLEITRAEFAEQQAHVICMPKGAEKWVLTFVWARRMVGANAMQVQCVSQSMLAMGGDATFTDDELRAMAVTCIVENPLMTQADTRAPTTVQ